MSAINLKVSGSPFIRSKISVEKLMYYVVVALLPATLASIYFFGLRALILTLVSVFACVGIQFLIDKLRKRDLTCFDGSAVVTGLLIALNIPSNLPYWMVIIGAAVAIILAKELFGGIGYNVFNPALVARVFLLISFPVAMTSWPIPNGASVDQVPQVATVDTQTGATVEVNSGATGSDVKTGASTDAATGATASNSEGKKVDALTGASPLGLLKEGGVQAIKDISLWDAFNGKIGGSLGETSALALLVGGAFLLIMKVITLTIPLVYIGSFFVITGICYFIDPSIYASPFFHLLSGGLILGAFFMATDMVTSPIKMRGQIIFALGCGVLTAVIRLWGGYPEGVSFAILIMNAFVPLLDRWDLRTKNTK